MTSYSLNTLRQIREHHKESADAELKLALHQHKCEAQRLSEIKLKIEDSVNARIQTQDDFFQKACKYTSNKTDVACQVLFNQRAMQTESQLKEQMAKQQELVQKAWWQVEMAHHKAVDANRHFKVLEKHYSHWQRRLAKTEEMKESYENDDQNGVRFILKKV